MNQFTDELAAAKADFNERTGYRYERVEKYDLLAEYCVLRGWTLLAATFAEAHNAQQAAAEVAS